MFLKVTRVLRKMMLTIIWLTIRGSGKCQACSSCEVDPPPCNSGIIGIYEDPNIVTSIPYSHYYRVGGPPKVYVLR